MERSYKFRLYPNKQQEQLIRRTFGCCRFVYNHFLSIRKERYETSQETLNYVACSRELTILKNELTWLKEVDCVSLQEALRNLDKAYQNFFRGLKYGRKVGYPVFKTKRTHRQSYRTKNHGNTIAISERKIKLPKLGFVKCAISKKVEGRILSATVIQNPSGKYFLSLCCTDVDIPKFPRTGAVIGIDLGLMDIAVTSDGIRYQNNRYAHASEKKLARLQKQLSRKSKGSKNREKARIKVARLYEHIENQRRDAMQKLTTEIVRGYDVICIEDLNVGDMIKNQRIAKSVSDASFAEFRRELEYKSAWYGKTISVVDAFYPSSQLCSVCGYRNTGTKDLSVRTWVCPECGTIHDRDVNAAKNILNEGMRLIA